MPYVLNLKSGLQCGVHQNDIFPLSKLHGRLYDIKLWHFWDLLPMTPCKYQNCDLQQILFHNICTCNAILVKFPHVPQNKADSPKMKMEKKR